MAQTILVVDDEPTILATLEGVLSDEGYQVATASDGQAALAAVETRRPDLVLLDIWMPHLDGLEALARIKADRPELPVVMMSGAGTIETAVRATKLGAFDYIEKPLSYEKIVVVIQNALEVGRLARENLALREGSDPVRLAGSSPAIEEVRRQIELVAPTDASVLITGQNGTGKEVAAHTLHAASPRSAKPMIAVNCAAIPEELIESELFGHEKGAFTGADKKKRGKFDLADGSTIFLDEIADMSLKTQAKILRILQEQRFERVGGTTTITVDARVIAATNRDLETEIREGRFREDLFYRLNVVPLQMPPLKNRGQDVIELAGLFLEGYCRKVGSACKELTPEAQAALTGHDWPGNVRELKNLIERLVILTPGPVIDRDDLPPPIQTARPRPDGLDEALSQATLREARAAFEKKFIELKLAENQGNISATAEVLGIERSHLHRKIKSLGVVTS